MSWWINNPSSIVLVLGAVSACVGSVIYASCSNMRLSRCSRIKCCCFECIRDVPTEAEIELELKNQRRSAPMPKPDNEI